MRKRNESQEMKRRIIIFRRGKERESESLEEKSKREKEEVGDEGGEIRTGDEKITRRCGPRCPLNIPDTRGFY